MTMFDSRISFVCNPRVTLAGSAYLRGFQLAELASRRFASVRTRRLEELGDDTRDEVLIFNKSCLVGHVIKQVMAALPALRRHNLCIADPLDAVVPAAALSEFDGAIAASFGQANHLSVSVPRPIYLIHHHVDFRLPTEAQRLTRAKAAYFGELLNAPHVRALADRVDFIAVDTANALDTSWMRHLPYYNLHYCLRRPRSIDGFKPATKIFVAAAMDALAIVARDDAEAARLLPSDYPFLVDSTDLGHVRATVERALGSFGGEDWRYAQDAMRAIGCYRPEPILDSLVEMIGAITATARAQLAGVGDH